MQNIITRPFERPTQRILPKQLQKKKKKKNVKVLLSDDKEVTNSIAGDDDGKRIINTEVVVEEMYQALVEFPLDLARGVDLRSALLRNGRIRGMGIALLVLGIVLVIIS